MEKPILFDTEMVQAILENGKTQTRRIVTPKPLKSFPLGFVIDSTEKKNEGCFAWGMDQYGGRIDYARPPYKQDDVLWVRETWCKADDGIYYKADSTPDSERVRKDYGYKWRPSIHMPRSATRIFLRVINVRVQRLHDITEEEAKAEGFNEVPEVFTAKELFEAEWNFIYKNWNDNPWVWVIEFERMEI